MGVGCACNSEGAYTCVVAVVDRAPVRDIRERVPTYQLELTNIETCPDKCEWFKGEPDPFVMLYTDELECTENNMYMD